MTRCALALALFLIPLAAPAADLATKKALTLEAAKEIAAAAQEYADKNDWKVIVAILDDGADLLYFERPLGVQLGSIDVALAKAESAIKFKRPTKAFEEGIPNKIGIAMIPGGFAIEGGLPIVWEGQVLGSIGISGVTSQQDGMIAQAAVDALPKILK